MLPDATFNEVIDDPALVARQQMLKAYGYDPLAEPIFWEAWLATQVGGETTPKKSPFDVLITDGRGFRFEVKFSSAFVCRFDNGPRPVFKWLLTKPQNAKRRGVNLVILIGADFATETLWTWCVPPTELSGRSITLTVPSARIGGPKGSRFDPFSVPPYDLLPGALRLADEINQENPRSLRDLRRGQLSLEIA